MSKDSEETMSAEVQGFIADYSDAVQSLFNRARGLVIDLAPDAIEQVDAPSHLVAYRYGPRISDMVFTLMPLKAGLNLGVYRGVELPDPAGLLTGSGKLHRHVRIQQGSDLTSPALRGLLGAAVVAARSRKGF